MISLAVIGIGNRAGKYMSCLGGNARVSVLVEPDPLRLQRASEKVGASSCYRTPEEFFASGEKVDGVIIAVPDRLHYPIAMEAVKRGMHVLVEKPAVVSWEQYLALEHEAEARGVNAGVCLVMRYHPYYQRIRELVTGGAVGKVLEISHTEHIGPDRMGHTFVRGGWSRKDSSGPIFLSKCSHDVDFILSLCPAPAKAIQVASSGSIARFKADMAPEGSTERCIACPLQKECLYSAVQLYRERREWIAGFDVPPGSSLPLVIEDVLENSRYGRCVYRCNNDVFDTQSTSILLEDGIRIDISLEGTSAMEGRETVIKGTAGELRAIGGIIECGSIREDYSELENAPLHAGADRSLLEDFIRSIESGVPMKASLQDAAEAHRICFLAG